MIRGLLSMSFTLAVIRNTYFFALFVNQCKSIFACNLLIASATRKTNIRGRQNRDSALIVLRQHVINQMRCSEHLYLI